jgi:hypothetical protein
MSPTLGWVVDSKTSFLKTFLCLVVQGYHCDNFTYVYSVPWFGSSPLLYFLYLRKSTSEINYSESQTISEISKIY